jgi:hypothetical protein
MRVSLHVRRPPTLLEQLVGRRRARMLRRRLGLLLLGSGASMLKPRTIWAPLAMIAAVLCAVVVGLGL